MRKPKTPGILEKRIRTLVKIPSSAVQKEAFNRKIASIQKRKKTDIENITEKFQLMTIPKNIDTTGTIMNTDGRNATIKLSNKLMNQLKDIYNMSEREQSEYAGLIECSFDKNYVYPTSPTKRTNYMREAVAPPQRTNTTKIVYHSHPAPPISGTTLVSIPSDMDFTAYIGAQKQGIVEGNLILDQNGVYVVDVVNNLNNQKNKIFQYFLEIIKSKGGMNYQIKDDLFFLNVDINRWQIFVNKQIDVLMKKNFGVSIKFYKWTELPLVRISL